MLRVRLDDGSLFLLDADHPAASLALELRRSNEEIGDERHASLLSADAACRCRRKALNLLAASEHCRRGLEIKLVRKKYPRDAVAAALDRLEAAGLLDDTRFAEAWTRSRLRSRPEGPSKLIGGLMSRGVSGRIAREAVDAVLEDLGDEGADGALERAFDKLSRKPGITDERLIAGLVRRGFPISRVRAFLADRESDDSGPAFLD